MKVRLNCALLLRLDVMGLGCGTTNMVLPTTDTVARSRKAVSTTGQVVTGVQVYSDLPRGRRMADLDISTTHWWNTRLMLHLLRYLKDLCGHSCNA